jgi:hypothetical protein
MSTKLSAHVSPDTGYFAFGATRDPAESMSPISRWIAQAYDYEDLSASTFSMHVPPGSRVLRVAHEVQVAFTGVTAMIVGDGDTTNGWIVSGTITPGTVGDFVFDPDSTFGAVGKFYQDGDTIDIIQTGVATAGEGILWVEVISYAEAVEAEAP